MKKHINSATEQYQDEYTDNWVLDDTPTEGSFNAVTSDGVAKAIEQGGGGTSYTAGDGINIIDGEISARVDGETINFNEAGFLQAIGGGTEYTAGDGIDIDNGEISVDYDTDTMTMKSTPVIETLPLGTPRVDGFVYFALDDTVREAIMNGTGTATLRIPGITFVVPHGYESSSMSILASVDGSFQDSNYYEGPNASLSTEANPYDDSDTVLASQTVTINLGLSNWSVESSFTSTMYLAFGYAEGGAAGVCRAYDDPLPEEAVPTIAIPVSAGPQKISVRRPLPASSLFDQNKVLTVNNSGTPVWAASDVSIYNVSNVSFASIVADVDAGKAVFLRGNAPGITSNNALYCFANIHRDESYPDDPNWNYVLFSQVYTNPDNSTYFCINNYKVDCTDYVENYGNISRELPSFDPVTDEGKVLQISDGALSWVTP